MSTTVDVIRMRKKLEQTKIDERDLVIVTSLYESRTFFMRVKRRSVCLSVPSINLSTEKNASLFYPNDILSMLHEIKFGPNSESTIVASSTISNSIQLVAFSSVTYSFSHPVLGARIVVFSVLCVLVRQSVLHFLPYCHY